VAVIDHGAGNLVSIGQAVEATGATPRIVDRPERLDGADLMVLPGVGAAAPAMRRLRRSGLAPAIVRWIEADRPFLGICLGLQLLFEASDEDGARTLGVIPGRTIRLAEAPTLPHIGWNQVERRRAHPAFDGVAEDADVYFVHSYAGAPEGPDSDAWLLGQTEHGARFVSAVARDRVVGLQFHPERSGEVGLGILANVLRQAIGGPG
jgi:imidazole glycerol phosphate synthase glutamine amidotransferase subunit